MSDEHSHSPASPDGAPGGTPDPRMTEDSGSQALSEALKSSFYIVRVVMVLLVVAFFASGVFQVGPQERKVILRLGRPVGEGNAALLGPGLHWAFPPPIDEVVRIPYTEIQTVKSTVGWYRTTVEQEALEAAGGPKQQGNASLDPAVDGYTVVGDGMIIHVRATLSYRVDDPIRFAFDFVNASNTVRNALDNALIYASAKFTNVDDVLQRERALFQETVRSRVDQLVHAEELGIIVEQCQVEQIAPLKLQPDFVRVIDSQTAMQGVRSRAASDRYQMTNQAASEAARRIIAAETARQLLVTNLETDVKLFNFLLPQYRANPALVESYYLNTAMTQIMTNVGGKWFLPAQGGGEPWEIRLMLGEQILPPKPAAPVTDMENHLE